MARANLREDAYQYADQVPLRLPLWVGEIGLSTWRRGAALQRLGSSIIAVEQVLSGSMLLVQAGRSSRIARGEVFILKRDADQEYRADAAVVRKQFVGLGGPLAMELTAALPDRVAPRDAQGVRRLFGRLRRLFAKRPPGWQIACAAAAYELLSDLLSTAQEQAAPARHHAAIAAAIRHLAAHQGRQVALGELAKAAGASPAHLNRLFRTTFRMSPLRYARARTIEQAKHLLSHSQMSCSEIAQCLGYQQPLYFSAVFRRLTGEPPSAYRARHQR